MTICIAAICKNKKDESIVFATDHMISTGLLGQFEHSITKYKEINSKTVAMISGDALLFDDLLNIKQFDASFDKIQKVIFKNIKSKKEEIIKNELFDKFMIDKKFFIDALQKQIPNNYVHNILKTVSEYNFDAKLLLIGFEGDLAQISVIDENGYRNYRDINFYAIGSGHIQAINTLYFQRHSKEEQLPITIYNVYKAKRNAEVHQGVGKETELLVLNKDKLVPLSPEQLKILENIYDKELEYGKTHKDLDKVCVGK